MRLNKKIWFIAPAFMAVLLVPACTNSGKNKILNDCSWKEIKQISKSGNARKRFKIGDTKDITINGKTQKARIIGFNQDKNSKGKKIGITFEFENLLSDQNGYCLAAYWQNTNTTSSANYDYLNSTIRAVLNDAGTASIKWFQYFGKYEDDDRNKKFSEEYVDTSVLDILPDDLVSELTAPTKYVSVYNHDETKFTETTVNDKLFLLSPREMGYKGEEQEASTFTYEYYEGHPDLNDEIRIKHQIGWHNRARTSALSKTGLDGSYEGTKSTYAGYNDEEPTSNGGYYWLRSASTNIYNGDAWFVDCTGKLSTHDQINVYNSALAIAPAFCI